MKRRLLLVLGGFAIGCVLPVFAQETDSADPRIGQQCDLLGVPRRLMISVTLIGLWTTHTIGTMQQHGRSFHRGRSFAGAGWHIQRQAAHRRKVCTRLPALA